MRLHAHSEEFRTALEHRPQGNGESVIVLLNGAARQDVVMADEEAGEVLKYVRDDIGNFTPDENGEVPTITLRGRVEIVLPSWWPR